MQKRTFLRLMGAGLAGVAAGSLLWRCAGPRVRKPVEGMPRNWLWMPPETGLSDDEWKHRLDKIRSAGIEAILPEVYNGSAAFFDHPTITVKERVLERIIPMAHAAGLQVHAWMWTMPCNNEDIVRDHPDWFAVNGKGEPAHTHPAYVDYYKFMCSRKPAVQEFVQGNVAALAKISELDGIHLDYVRLPDVILAETLQPKYNIVQDREYPEYDYCYCPDCRALFREQTGIDPLTDLEDPSANEAWRQFRYDGVTNLVNGKLVPTAHDAGKKITAAVFPNWEMVRQQWHRWDLDGFLPMLYHSFYNADLNWIKQQVEAALGRLNHTKPVYSGLFIPALQPEELRQAIALSLEGGAGGISLFEYGSLTDAHWAVLEEVLAG